MSQSQRLGAFYLDQSSLQCKAGCGFFGNPEWSGYCSICFKQLSDYRQSQSTLNHRNNQRALLEYQQSITPTQSQYEYPSQQQYPSPHNPMRQQTQSNILLRDNIRALRKPFHKNLSTQEEVAGIEEIDSQQASPLSSNIDNIQRQTPGTPTSANSSVSKDSTNIFGTIASPTSLVMMGYDTLTNLHNTILNTAKSSFRASPSASTDGGDRSSVHSTSQSEYQASRSQSKKPWQNFVPNTVRRKSLMEQQHFLYDVAWVDCLNQTNRFAREFLAIERRNDKSIYDLSDMIHDFYEKMTKRFETQLIYKGATQDQLELLNDNMERILNEHIYHVISARIINEDEDHNMAVQKRIRSLNWITVEHLEIEIDFQRPVVHDLLDKAICQMVEMNSRTSSIDKLESIVQCSKTIFELLQVGQPVGTNTSIPASADQFLPVLVFVVIQANPPMIPADMKYLTRFSNPRRLMSGETGYYFTNLCCALEFIEKASGASLNISEEEFNRFMTGEAVPETKSEFHTYLCDGLRTMCSNDAALKKLKRDNESRLERIDNLFEQIDVHIEINRAKSVEMQTYASNLEEKLQPQLSDIFQGLQSDEKEKASRLLPSYHRQIMKM